MSNFVNLKTKYSVNETGTLNLIKPCVIHKSREYLNTFTQ